jgi:hypothetical protein
MATTTSGITAARPPRRRRQLLPAIAIAVGAITSYMTLATPVAHADIKKFNDCIKGATIQGSVVKDCCAYAGGTYNPSDSHGEETCEFAANSVIDPGRQEGTTTNPAPPPPGATAILPPGANTRAGIQ